MALPAPHPDYRAVVTGASSGIGRALARELARRGHALILVARSADKMEALAAELARPSLAVEVRPCDLSDAAARAELIAELRDRKISVMVNCAGIATFGRFQDLDPAHEKAQFELNATALFDLTQLVVPQMVERGSGAILNVGSAAGTTIIPNNVTYVGTKAFVNSFTESLHYDLKGTGVHCTLLAPGPVRPDERDAGAHEVDDNVPDFLCTSTEACARDSLDALAGNRLRVVPGALSKAMDTAGNYLPRRLVAPIIGRFYEGMSQ